MDQLRHCLVLDVDDNGLCSTMMTLMMMLMTLTIALALVLVVLIVALLPSGGDFSLS